MGLILRAFAILGFIYALIQGFVYSEGLAATLTWWGIGAAFAALFFAIALLLDYAEDISYRLQNVEHELNKSANPPRLPPKLGNSKAKLEKLRGFKL